MNKIYDCITFYDENLLVNSRFEILKDVVDFHVVCESKYDHSGNEKNINFKLLNQKYNEKVKHILIDEKFPNPSDGWSSESFQREKIFLGIKNANEDDFIMFSDSDEIPNPKKLLNFKLNKKFGIFMQNFYVYKLNIFNEHESPWEGTRICKKKNLKNFTHLRKKINKKNIFKPFWKFNVEKSIEVIENGGWHFNNLYPVEVISKKLKSFPHKEFSGSEFSNIEVIKEKISNLEDLFKRGHKYKIVNIDDHLPEYIIKNKKIFIDYF